METIAANYCKKCKIIVLIVFCLLILALTGCGKKKTRGRYHSKELPPPPQYATANRDMAAFSYKLKQRLDEHDVKLKQIEERLKKLEESGKFTSKLVERIQQDQKDQTANILEQLRELNERITKLQEELKSRPHTAPVARTKKQEGTTKKQSVTTGFVNRPPIILKEFSIKQSVQQQGSAKPVQSQIANEKEVTKTSGREAESKAKDKFVFLPAGTVAKGTILSGIYAPIDTAMPMPVALSLDEVPIGPNGASVPLKNCVVFAKASGVLQGTRAILQLVRLSCIMPDGKPVEVEVDGYVTDEDGLPGVKGHLESVPKNVMVSAGIASFLSALTSALAEAETTTVTNSNGDTIKSVTGSTKTYMLSKGAAGFLKPFENYYSRVMRATLPVITAQAGKQVHIFFRKGVVLEGYKLDYLYSRRYSTPFTGLD